MNLPITTSQALAVQRHGELRSSARRRPHRKGRLRRWAHGWLDRSIPR